MITSSTKRNFLAFKNRYWFSHAFSAIVLLVGFVYLIFINNKKSDSLSLLMQDPAFHRYQDEFSKIEAVDTFIVYFCIIVIFASIAGAILIGIIQIKMYYKRFNHLKTSLSSLAQGHLPEIHKNGNTEFKELLESTSAIKDFHEDILKFQKQVSEQKFNETHEFISKKHLLSEVSNSMITAIQGVISANKKRLWVNESLAESSDIMRLEREDLGKFSFKVLQFICRKAEAILGNIFVLNEEENEPFMELVSTYAFDKRKVNKHRVFEGEGLIGRVWKEKTALNIDQLPEDYITIKTGILTNKPQYVTIIPMVMDDKIVGIIELAFYKKAANEKFEFIQRCVNQFATIYANLSRENMTKSLLQEAQQLGEEARASEEEIRQNMEELQAIQEEFQRKEKETERLLSEAQIREQNLLDEIKRLQKELVNQ